MLLGLTKLKTLPERDNRRRFAARKAAVHVARSISNESNSLAACQNYPKTNEFRELEYDELLV